MKGALASETVGVYISRFLKNYHSTFVSTLKLCVSLQMENKKSQGKKSSGIIATKKSDPQHDDGDGTAGEETPEFMPTPFGTKLVAVKKKEKGTVDIFKRPASPTPLPAKRRKVLSEDKFAEVSYFLLH